MTMNKLFAFFTKSPVPISLATYTENNWKEVILRQSGDPFAEAIIIHAADWQAPVLKSLEPSEIKAVIKNPRIFVEQMCPVLEKYGVPVSVAGNCMTESWYVPFPEFQMVAYVLPYTNQMQDLVAMTRSVYAPRPAPPRASELPRVSEPPPLSQAWIDATPIRPVYSSAPVSILASDKSPVIAALLSFFLLGGAGQIYLGQVKKGLAIMICAFFLNFMFIGFIISMFGAGDAYGTAQKLRDGDAVGEWDYNINWKVVGLAVVIGLTMAMCVFGVIFLAAGSGRQG
jgi:hypothetical protein